MPLAVTLTVAQRERLDALARRPDPLRKINGLPRGYFIEASGLGWVKIGWSSWPLGRLIVLQVGCPVELRLVGVVPGSEEVERDLHRRFAAQRGRREWFAVSDEMLDYLESLAVLEEPAA